MSGQSPYMSAAQYAYPNNFQPRDVRYSTNPNVDNSMGLNHRRPSLLASYHNHFTSPDRNSLTPYAFSLGGPASMGTHTDEHSKRSRYSATIPLSIDVKKEQALYQPQTEAISPSLEEPKNDSNMRDSTIIRNSISKLDSDIQIAIKKLHRARLSQSEIKSQADRSAADEDENDTQDDLFKTNGSQTLIEKILHDNRKVAEDGQRVLNRLHNNIDLTIPLYHEPSDLEPIDEIRTQYMNVMKNRLINLFKKSRERYMCQTKFESEKYDQAYEEWQKSIEKDEKSILAKDISTYRETFEKTFSEIRKAREDKEKKQSAQTSTDPLSSSTDQPVQSTTNSTEQESDEQEDEKMRKSSVIPPIMYDRWQRKHQYFNNNGLIKGDAAAFYKEQTKMPYWTPEEKQIFIEKFTQSPKNFGYISAFLENKTTEQCVQFYYMTKKAENYKNLLRKQSQANKRRARQNPTTTTTTTVTASTTIKTTFVTRVTSNTIVSSTSQQTLGSGQDAERPADRMDNDVDRRDMNTGDTGDDKRLNKNRCQFISCTTDKGGKKKYRKTRLRDFPPKWNELSKEHQEEIRRLLQIPSEIQRCCPRCYDKLTIQVRQRHASRTAEDDDEVTLSEHQNSKHDDEKWTEAEAEAFTQALDKFNHDWTQIAEYVHRSEESCRAFYLKQCKTTSPIDDPNNDDDNGSISGSELGQTKQVNDDNELKTINEDSNDSTQGMVIDEGEEQTSTTEEKVPAKSTAPTTTNFSTITSLVEKEIYKTLNETEKRLAASNTNTFSSPERQIGNSNNPTHTAAQPPPPLVNIKKSQSPAAAYPYPSHPQQSYLPTGSIMRGTPISSSTPSNKPIAADITSPHSHHYHNTRTDYPHHKAPKILDRNAEQQQLIHQQQQHAYMRQYAQQPQQQQQQAYLQQQQQQQQHKSAAKIEPPSTDTFETLRADYLTSKYLATTHSPSHERQHRPGPDQRSPSQPSPAMNQPLLPPPSTIGPPTGSPSVSSLQHSHHSQQQAAILAASQFLASNGVYSQDILTNSLLPYTSYYGSLPPTSPFLFDPRLMHEYAAANNSEQLKAEHHKAAMRFSRHHHHHQGPNVPVHSPPDASYPPHSSKRHSHDLGYPGNDYPAQIWRTQNMTNPQQVHSQMKHSSATNENPLLKHADLSRHAPAHVPDRSSRSPDDYHHRLNSARTGTESATMHFQRTDAHNHHNSSHEKSNPNPLYSDHSNEGNPSNYMRHATTVHKPQATHRHSQHHHSASSNARTLQPPPMPNSQISPQHATYLMHGHHHLPVDTPTSQRSQQQSPHQHHQSHYSQQQQHHQQQRTNHHSEASKTTKESMSIQEFINKNVNEFVSSKNNDSKASAWDSETHESANNSIPRNHQASNSNQLILIDGDEDSNPIDQSDLSNKANSDGDMPERRRDSSIKKILSNQPLEKQEYVEINQKVQNSATGTSKANPNANDPSSMERSNSTNARTRSRGSITMRMLMGSSDIYADGKAQPMPTNEEQSNKRPASPHANCEKIDYLIRGELDRPCPTLVKQDEIPSIFKKSSSAHSQPTSSKRLRTSPDNEESHHSSTHSTPEPPMNARDPFALQPHSKSQHHQSTSSPSTNEKNWQSYMQQQQYFLNNPYSSPFASRSSRPTGSITQGSPMPPSSRTSTDQSQHSSAANNQLINPRYAQYINKNEQQSSPSPTDRSSKGMSTRKADQSSPVSSDGQPESFLSVNNNQSSTSKSPLPMAPAASSTPPIATSPTTPSSSSSAHSLKKRLISEYELEQQRNSPVIQPTEEAPTTSTGDAPKTEPESIASETEMVTEAAPSKSAEEPETSS
ncbi:unnamed protein product [Adineta ricciae]|uniref:Uncharacterized protein n=1 Tax=Adineta ricciae TaxID=249248 RepID=A0A813VG87_ADIRI|nr:unnamed protein product [Adineta ricciae]